MFVLTPPIEVLILLESKRELRSLLATAQFLTLVGFQFRSPLLLTIVLDQIVQWTHSDFVLPSLQSESPQPMGQ